jgi:hypothetical protein
MSLNHQSFLKMIGFDEEPSSEASLSETVDAQPLTETGMDFPQEAFEEAEAPREEEVFAEEMPVDEGVMEELVSPRPDQTEIYSKTGLNTYTKGLPEDSELSDLIQNSMSDFSKDDLVDELADLSVHGTRPTVAFDYDNEPDPIDDSANHYPPLEQKSSTGGTLHFDYSKEAAASRIVVLEGEVNAKAFHLSTLPLRIGRDLENEVVIDQSNISRFHAEIRQRDDEMVIADLGSTNGIKVNGQLTAEHPLKSHDIIQIGDIVFEFLGPGELSKGFAQAVIIQNQTASGAAASKSPAKKKAYLRYIALILIVGAIGYYLFGHRGQIKQQAEDKSAQILVKKVESEISDLKLNIERDAKKPIAELPADQLKKVFLDRLSQNAISQFIPAEIKNQIQSVPPELIKVFLEDPGMISSVISSGGSKSSVEIAFRTKLNDLIAKEKYRDALIITEFLLQIKPNDPSLKSAVEKLKPLVEATEVDASDGLTKEEREQIDAYLNDYDKKLQELIEKEKLSEAIRFSKTVRDRILALAKKEARFEKVGKAEAEKWNARVADLEQIQADEKKREYDATVKDNRAESLLATIKSDLDMANTAEAKAGIDEFLEKYPDHPRASEVIAMKQEMQKALQVTFATTKANIEKFIQAESYEGAWQEYYRYVDMMPQTSESQQLKDFIEKKTSPKAMQYYNQARVFEFEADDLIAAEQYYKRSLEVADPRSELFNKATRRYAEVRRKTIQ